MVPWRRNRLPPPVCFVFPSSSDSKESTCSVGDLSLIPGSGRSPGGEHGNVLWYSWLENPQGQRNLVGCSSCWHKDLYTTDWQSMHTLFISLYYGPLYLCIIKLLLLLSFLNLFIYIFSLISQSSWEFINFAYFYKKQNILLHWIFYWFSSL